MKNFIKHEKPLITAVITTIIIKSITAFEKFYFYPINYFIFSASFVIAFLAIIYASKSVVDHSEILALKFGEPYGTLIFTLSSLVVEIVMISTIMINGQTDPALARDTIYFSLTILINGFIGFTLLMGGLRYKEQNYNLKSTRSYQSMIIVLVGLSLFMPRVLKENYITPFYILIIISSIILYLFFLRMQTVSHTHFFIMEDNPRLFKKNTIIKKKDINGVYHFVMMFIVIFMISVLGEFFSRLLDDTVELYKYPTALKAFAISILLVTPEAITSIKSGLKNDIQRTFNIAFGSFLSTIALLVPAALIIGLLLGREIILGVSNVQAVIIILTLLIAHIAGSDGKTNPLDGSIQLVLFAASILLVFI